MKISDTAFLVWTAFVDKTKIFVSVPTMSQDLDYGYLCFHLLECINVNYDCTSLKEWGKDKLLTLCLLLWLYDPSFSVFV